MIDAVGINCKNGASTKNQGVGVKYTCYVLDVGWLCVLSDLTCLPILDGGSRREKVMVY